MRRLILTSLVLLPVMAHAQANIAAGPQPSTSSAMLQAELAMAAAPITPITSGMTAGHPVIREFVQTRMSDSFADAALRQAGTLQYGFMGGLPQESTAPAVTRAVELELSQQELAAQPALTNVVIHATVDEYGFARNLTVAQSAGAMLDKKALAAVGQYRFKPATLDNKPVEAAVTISIKIQKQ